MAIETPRRGFLRKLAATAAVVELGGCTSVGPRSIPADQLD